MSAALVTHAAPATINTAGPAVVYAVPAASTVPAAPVTYATQATTIIAGTAVTYAVTAASTFAAAPGMYAAPATTSIAGPAVTFAVPAASTLAAARVTHAARTSINMAGPAVAHATLAPSTFAAALVTYAVPATSSTAGSAVTYAVLVAPTFAAAPVMCAVPANISIAGTAVAYAVPAAFTFAAAPVTYAAPATTSFAGPAVTYAATAASTFAAAPGTCAAPATTSIAGPVVDYAMPAASTLAAALVTYAAPATIIIAGDKVAPSPSPTSDWQCSSGSTCVDYVFKELSDDTLMDMGHVWPSEEAAAALREVDGIEMYPTHNWNDEMVPIPPAQEIQDKKPVMIGVAADSGCGKTTFLKRVLGALGTEVTPGHTPTGDMMTVVCLDDYHLNERAGRKATGLTALDAKERDFDLMGAQMQALREKKALRKPIHSHDTGAKDPPELIQLNEVLICEGLHAIYVLKACCSGSEDLHRHCERCEVCIEGVARRVRARLDRGAGRFSCGDGSIRHKLSWRTDGPIRA